MTSAVRSCQQNLLSERTVLRAPAKTASASMPDVLRDGDARPERGVGLWFAEPYRDRHHARPSVGRAVLRLVGRAAGANLDRGLDEREREDRGSGQLFFGGLARVGPLPGSQVLGDDPERLHPLE